MSKCGEETPSKGLNTKNCFTYMDVKARFSFQMRLLKEVNVNDQMDIGFQGQLQLMLNGSQR